LGTFKLMRVMVAASLAAAILSGCASSESTSAHAEASAMLASRCQSGDRLACESADKARQLRDETAYREEPALGYASMPQGLAMPMPTVAHSPSQ
jgi:hypothetical protein